MDTRDKTSLIMDIDTVRVGIKPATCLADVPCVLLSTRPTLTGTRKTAKLPL